MKRHRARAKTTMLSFPVRNSEITVEDDSLRNENVGHKYKYNFNLEDVLPEIDYKKSETRIVRSVQHAQQKQKNLSTNPPYRANAEFDNSPHAHHDRGPSEIPNKILHNLEIGSETGLLTQNASTSFPSPNLGRKPHLLLPAPVLNPKLKYLKSQIAQTLSGSAKSANTNSIMNLSNNNSTYYSPNFLPFSQLKFAKGSSSTKISYKHCQATKKQPAEQQDELTNSDKATATANNSIYKRFNNSTIIIPRPTITAPASASSSNKSRHKKKSETSMKNGDGTSPNTSALPSQSPSQPQQLIATTNEIELLKLTPRNPSTVKSGIFNDNPAKSSSSNGKKYHVCRSQEEREANPDEIYLDNFNLKNFPSIDSSETQLRLLSLQNNHLHRIEPSNNNLLTIQSQLLVLDLYNNRIDRISGLHVFSSLKVLLLGKNRIRRIEGLDTLRHLEILDLHGNQLRYLDNINTLTSLRVLNVAGNVIRSIRNFGPYGISSLHELNLKRNQLQNLTGILKMVHLKKLCLGNNNIQNVSILFPLKKLELLKELLLHPNPICDQLNYTNQIISLLPNLELLDSEGVTKELRSSAEIWYRNKLFEEQERRKELEKLKLLSNTSTRDEIILKARKRWESLRNYIRKNSIGSGEHVMKIHKELSRESQKHMNRSGDDEIAIRNEPSLHGQVVPDKSKFVVELEMEPQSTKIDEKESIESSTTDENQTMTFQAQTDSEICSKSQALGEHESQEIPTVPLPVSVPMPSLPSSHYHNMNRTPKIAIVRPNVRSKDTSAPICAAQENPPAVMPKIPMLAHFIKSTGHSVLEEEDEDEVFLEGAAAVSSELMEGNVQDTLIDQERHQPLGYEQASRKIADISISQYEVTSQPEPQVEKSPLEILDNKLMCQQKLPTLASSSPQQMQKIPDKKPIMRRTMSSSQFPLVSLPENKPSTSTSGTAAKKYLQPSPRSKLNTPPNYEKLRKSFAKTRSKSISDLKHQQRRQTHQDLVGSTYSSDDETSEVESVTTGTSINTNPNTSDTGSTTTTTPRRPTRPKLVRSNSTRNLLKPRGKTAKLGISNPSLPTFRRPLTSITSNDGTASSNNPAYNNKNESSSRPPLRRSESAISLNTSFMTNNNNNTANEVILKKQGADYLIEINDKCLNVYGQGALKHILTAFSSNSTSSITMVTFHFITFDSIIPYFSKMRQIYPTLEHFHFRANGLSTLAQLNALADLQGINSLYVFQDGNPLIENRLWEEYAMYRLGHWGLQQVNGKEVLSNYRSLGSTIKENDKSTSKTFDSLGYLALSCLPQSALTPLAERLHTLHCFCCCSTSNSSEELAGKKKSDNYQSTNTNTNTCSSYWDDDPVLLDVIGKEALVYVPPNEVNPRAEDIITEIFENGCEIIKKLDKLEEVWPVLVVEVIEDILLDYQVMDNFMKKELIGLKNSMTANSGGSSGGSSRKRDKSKK